MPTEKPRTTVTLEESQLKFIEQYKYENRISTLSKALNKIISIGIEQIKQQEESKKAPIKESNKRFDYEVRVFRDYNEWTEFYFGTFSEMISFLKICDYNGFKVEVIQH